MSGEQMTEQRIGRWLAEQAPSQMPDRVLGATFERTRTTRQVRARRWRFPGMTPFQTSLAAAAAFVLAAAGGLALVARPATLAPVGSEGLAIACPGTTPDPASQVEPPLGLALVCLDGSLALDLGLPRDAWAADLSPDGTHVAFRTSDLSAGECGSCANAPYLAIVKVGSDKGAFVINVPFEHPTQVAWSPDGLRIAYQAERDGNVDIYVTELGDLDGPVISGGGARTTRLTDDPAIDEFPAWTPDGSAIVYSNMGAEGPDDSGFSPTQAIWSVPAGGGTPTRLGGDDTVGTMPDVAPKGTIAFFGGDGEIWTMGPDGSDATPLSIDPGGRLFSPRWSPDGSRIAALRYHPGERTTADAELGVAGGLALLDVLVIDPASGEVIDVGPRVATDYNPVSWTPDGQALLVDRYLAD